MIFFETICSQHCYKIITAFAIKGNSIEPGKVLSRESMTVNFTQCVTFEFHPPGIVLGAMSELMRLYPYILRASLLLNRFVQ
ncbi:MAG TPA: hypothetical protein DDW24_04945 [Blastocatellia bacterium]|nr:hypothetical protein [Blastocatellia bacterium]